MQRRRDKADHLRELTRSNESTIRFGEHKNTIKGKTADICQCMRQPNTTHRFDRMDKKPG